jgi:hypothetical protein
MLKYGQINSVLNFNSNTLLPRNLTNIYNFNNTTGNNTIGNNTIGNNTIGNNTTGNNTTGNNTTGNNTTGNNTTVNNLTVNTITFNDNLNINSINGLIELKIDQNSIEIAGPNIINSLSNNTINNIGASLNITNTENFINSITYKPITKIFLLSGYSLPNQNIIFILQNIYISQFSGKLNIMSKSLENNLINIYDINIWSTSDSTIEYTNIDPINLNNLGDWSINKFDLDNNNLVINCNGSINNNVLWTIKLDSLTI